MKNYLQKILDGFLFGLGLSIPLTIGYALSNIYYYEATFGHKEITDLENYGLVFKEQRVEKSNKKAYIIGDIYNPNENPLTSVNIMAEFHDGNGKFIDKCTGTINGVVRAEQTRNYKLECAPLLKPYATYKLVVASAYVSDLW